MTIDEILRRPGVLQVRAARLWTQYEKMKNAADVSTTNYDGSGVFGHDPARREKILVRMADLRIAWADAALDAIEARQNLFNELLKLQSNEELEALCCRYLDEKTIDETMVKLGDLKRSDKPLSRTQTHKYINAGKTSLKEILLSQGIDVE